MSDDRMVQVGVSENRQRENPSAVEDAEAMDLQKRKLRYTHERLAEIWGYKTPSTIANKLRLLKLPADVRELNVERDEHGTSLLPERTARALVRMYDLDAELMPYADAARFDLHQLAGAEVRGPLVAVAVLGLIPALGL